MNIEDRIKRFFRLRFAILYPVAIFVAFAAQVTPRSIALGACFMAPGVFLRLWSNSYAVKTEKLTTCGPYAFLRNPLYLGTLLILCGAVILVKIYWLGAVALLAFAFAYARTIKQEEVLLEGIYKDEYRAYVKEVPSFIPRLTPYGKGDKWSFSAERLLRSKEHKIFIWLAIAVIGLYLKEEILLKHGTLTPGLWAWIGLAVFLALLDLLSEIKK